MSSAVSFKNPRFWPVANHPALHPVNVAPKHIQIEPVSVS
jgi:hypothetical protein